MIRGPVAPLRKVKTFEELAYGSKPPKITVPFRPGLYLDGLAEGNVFSVTNAELSQLGLLTNMTKQAARVEQARATEQLLQNVGVPYQAGTTAGDVDMPVAPLEAQAQRRSEAAAASAAEQLARQAAEREARMGSMRRALSTVVGSAARAANALLRQPAPEPMQERLQMRILDAERAAMEVNRLPLAGPIFDEETLQRERARSAGMLLGQPSTLALPAPPLFTEEQMRREPRGLIFGNAVPALMDAPRQMAVDSGERSIVALAPPPGRVGMADPSTEAAPLVPTIPRFIIHSPGPSPSQRPRSQSSISSLEPLTPEAAAREAASNQRTLDWLTQAGRSPDFIMDNLIARNDARRRGRTRSRRPLQDGEAIAGPMTLQRPLALADRPDRENIAGPMSLQRPLAMGDRPDREFIAGPMRSVTAGTLARR